MKLHDLRALISESWDEYWHVIEVGPYYHDRIWVDGDLDFHGTSHSHYYRAVFTDDLRISIEWGLDTEGREHEDGHVWAREHQFPDPKITSLWVDVFYGGDIVDRVRLLSVDGGRAYLPNYRTVRSDGGSDSDFSNATYDCVVDDWEYNLTVVGRGSDSDFSNATYDCVVDDWEYNLTRVVSDIAGLREFDGYFARSGMVRASA